MEMDKDPKPQIGQHPDVVEKENKNGNGVDDVEVAGSGDGNDSDKKRENLLDNSPSAAQPTPKRRKLDKAEKEAERLKREEEKRLREQERLEKLRVKEEEKRRKEEERVRREEEKKRKDEEKKRKDEEKEQERLKREEEKRQRDEEKKRKDEEKEQERLKREEEKKRKEEERLKKEEEKRKRDEEKRKKDEEKKQAQEKAEEVKQRQADFMSKFLQNTTPSSANRKPTSSSASESKITPNSASSSSANEGHTSSKSLISLKTPIRPIEVIDLENEVPNSTSRTGKNLLARFNSAASCRFNPMPFQVKIGMALAPAFRRTLSEDEKTRLDQTLPFSFRADTNLERVEVETMEIEGDVSVNDSAPAPDYLKEIKTRPLGKSGKTLVRRNSAAIDQEDEIEVLYDKSSNEIPTIDPSLMEHHFKLLQFFDNRRPAYWGTWKARPQKVSGRRPFAHEEDVDYEFESDDEWEDEPEDAEELKSEKESDDEEATLKNDEEDDDEGWMVPHGYLSDDERADGKIGGEEKGETGEESGESKILDKDALKKEEEQYYKEIKLDKKLGLPYIQTDNLSGYRMILFKKKKERCIVKRKSAAPFYEKLKDAKEGRLTSLYDGYASSDEEDSDWEESEGEHEENSSDSDENYVSEDEDALLEELDLKKSVTTNKNKNKSVEVMDIS